MTHVFHGCVPSSGFYDLEQDHLGPFVWAQTAFTVQTCDSGHFLFFELERPDAAVRCVLDNGAVWSHDLLIHRGWHHYAVQLPEKARQIDFHIERPFPVPEDSRELAVRFRSLDCTDDEDRFLMIQCQSARRDNSAMNRQEYLHGREQLTTVPPRLRLTLETRCNIANTAPCVYCSWNWAKRAEADYPHFDMRFLDELGPFLELAEEVNDCSYGEPTLHPQFPALAERLSRHGRLFNLTSNGQTLTPKTRKALLGREIILYVSIDSSTGPGYARLRNDRFDVLLDHLRALCHEKRSCGGKPTVTVSCIVMRSNSNELPDIIKLFHDVGVDRIYFRALWPEDNLENRRVEHCGTVFDYAKELLGYEELLALAPAIRQAAAATGQDVAIEWENVPTDFSGHGCVPLCSEPWNTLYLLNRGIMPCSFARRPVATWADRGAMSTREFIDTVFNGPGFTEIRRELAQGRFPRHCLNTPNCPLVRRRNLPTSNE